MTFKDLFEINLVVSEISVGKILVKSPYDIIYNNHAGAAYPSSRAAASGSRSAPLRQSGTCLQRCALRVSPRGVTQSSGTLVWAWFWDRVRLQNMN